VEVKAADAREEDLTFKTEFWGRGDETRDGAELLTKALLPWMIRIEKAISSLLPNPRYLKFNVDGFLRGDSSARWAVYEIASRINAAAVGYGQPPVLLTSEMREFEDLNIVEEYPTPEVPASVPTDPQMNSAQPTINVTVHTPEQRSPDVHVTNDVHVPEQRTPDVNVTVEPAGVVVDVQPTTVHVPAAEVRVVSESPEVRTVTKTVHRDADGRIQTVTEEIS
jgi:hypothetical protein